MTGAHPPTPWRPALGAWPETHGTRFRVWAPERREVRLIIEPGPRSRAVRLERSADGTCEAVADAAAGTRYAYLLDDEGPYPDPASRFQPDGVHGSSAVVDPTTFRWTDHEWRGVPVGELIIYELHVGAFTPAGSFSGLLERLGYLQALGITAIELMPIADFPGARNWGYDGVSLFAPARCYGTPDDLRQVVDAAHGLGLAVLLDVVYNHFGPDGAYIGRFSPHYFSARHHTPWGQAVNLDGPHAESVRSFFVENALHWLHEYHLDGLRLDATHALVDESPRHFLAELSDRVHESVRDRRVVLIAEDDRNLATIVTPAAHGGFGLDAIWADDFHHHTRRRAAGDRDGYFQDYSGSAGDLAATLRKGWFYTGQPSTYRGAPRGTDPGDLPLERFVIALQNHDQIGNRALGERLNQQIDPAMFRALSALLLFAAETPLLFMGQEWAASSPFLYFTDHQPELGRLVTEGRRAEFSRFAAFADGRARMRIPDPQASSTFEASRLRWAERGYEPHASTERLYRALIALRKTEAALRAGGRFDVTALDEDRLALMRADHSGSAMLMMVNLGGVTTVAAAAWPTAAATLWKPVLTTEDAAFTDAPLPPEIDATSAHLTLHFQRPSAIILRAA